MFGLPHLPYVDRINKLTLEYLYGVSALFLIIAAVMFHEEVQSKFGLINQEPPTITNPIIFSYSPQTIPETEAKAYVVYDIISKKVIIGKNEEMVLPLASMTKLATALTASTLASSTQLITITPSSIDEGYDIGLRKGQIFKLSELIKYMLVFSSNDAANAVANSLGGKKAFVKGMNQLVQSEGLQTLYFTNPNGLDDGTEYGGEGSALDVAKLMALVHRDIPALLDATTKARAKVIASTGTISGVPNTNQDVEQYVGIEGSKTGFTDEAGGNLVVVFDVAVGRPVVIVVMGSTRQGRFKDVEKLYTFTKKALE